MGRTSVGCVWLAACGLSAAPAAAQSPPGAAFPAAPAAVQPAATPPAATPPAATSAPAATPPAPAAEPAAPAPAPAQPAATAPLPPPAQPAPVVAPQYAAPGMYPSSYAFAEPPRPVYPEDSAVQSSPFLGATVSLVSLEDRFTDPLVIGLSFGGYIARAVRLVARIEMPSTDDTENYYYENNYPGYSPVEEEPPTLLYGGSLGIIAAHSQSLVFAPGVMFLRSDVSAYGNMVGVSIPFDWTTNRGLRFGLEVGFGRSFGGTSRQRCTYTPSCESGDEVTSDREAARAFTLRFELGFGFNHPKPQQPQYSQPPGSGWAPAGGGALPPPAFQAQPAAPLPPPQPPAPPQPAPHTPGY